jgi:hypothetical protein
MVIRDSVTECPFRRRNAARHVQSRLNQGFYFRDTQEVGHDMDGATGISLLDMIKV